MKKRLLSALLALALVFVLLPTTALAGVAKGSDYDISINGTNYVFSGSETCYFKNNFTTTEPSGSYLKLTKSSDTITVTVSGYVTVSDINVHNNFSTQDKINLIITGNKGSTLNIECKDTYGAALETYQSGDITIKGGITVNANFSADNTDRYTDCYGIRASKNLIITGKGTTVNAVNADDAAAVKVDGNITVSDGAQLKATNKYSKKVTNYTGNAYAIECGGLSISGNNTKVTAKTSNGKQAISGTVSDGDKLTFKVQLYLASSTLYQKPMDEALKYTHVEITQAPTDPYVFIAGEPAIMDQETPIPGGSGTYLYVDAGYDGNILTLKDATINKTSNNDTNAIKFTDAGTYTVNLEGTNKMSGVGTGILAANVKGEAIDVIISGSGSLDISARSRTIEVSGNLTFNNTGTINLKTTNTADDKINAIKVSGDISVGSDFNKNLKITTDNGDFMLGVSDLNSLNKCKSITIAPKPSKTYYNGTAMKYGETRTVGNGTISCDEKGVITLNGVTEGTLEFRSSADSTLVLEGTSTLSSIVTTQKGLTISGSGSLTVGSIKVHNQKTSSDDKPNLTITGAAQVTVNRPSSEDLRAIDIDGDLTVTNGSLTATSKSDSVPTVQVGGNASFTGSTVTITNNSTTQGERYKDSYEVSSALHVNGAVTISGGKVMAEAKAGGNAIRAVGNITVSNDATVTAKNNSQYFNAITAGRATGGEVNTLYNLIVSGENTRITATNTHDNNLTYGGAINAYIKNANEGHYLKVGTDTKAIAPNAKTTVRNNSLTITRGDAYETPQVAANYTIAGQTMHVGKYYKTDAKGNITDGTAQDYNIYCDSKNDFTLNNATISSTGTDVAINTNIRYETNVQHHIKLIGTNRINNTFKHAISAGSNSSTIIIEGVGNASDASLTINGNFLPIYSDGKVIINAEVVIVNTTDDNSFKGLISTSDGKGAFDLGSGYKCYASTSTTGTPLEVFNSANYGTYKYLRVTTQTLETGGGSTHQHVWDEAWHDTGDYHHAHQCTICKAYDTTTQELHNVTGHRDNHDGSHSNICGSCGYSAKVSHSYTWAPKANDNEKHIGTCVCGNVVEKNHNFVGDVCQECGYDKSTGTTCEHVWTTEWTIDTVDNEYHWHVCTKCGAIADKKAHAYTIVTDNGTNHTRECECKVFYVEDHISSDWIIDTPATATTAGSMHKECTVCKHKMQTEVIPATGEIEPPTPDNPGTIVIIRPAEEEKPAQQPNPSTGANDLVGLAVAAAVAAALGSAALLRKHD